MILLIGISVQGGFIGYYPAATRIYETEIRATGVGWAIGAGRFGAIAGPALFGMLSDLNLSNGNLFILFSIPLLISGFAIYSVPSNSGYIFGPGGKRHPASSQAEPLPL